MIISQPNGSGTRWTTRLFRDNGLTFPTPDNYHIMFRKGEETEFHKEYFQKNMGKYMRRYFAGKGRKLGKNEAGVVKQIEVLEKDNIKRNSTTFNIKLSTWGGRGLLKNVSVPVIWILRDPVQTYITAMYNHSEDFHHYCRKIGTPSSGMREGTLNAWLFGPLQYWVGQFKYMLEDKDSYIIRLEKYVEDFSKVFEDERFECYKPVLFKKMKSEYSPHVYNIEEELSPWVINYIQENTNEYYEWRKTWE